MDKLPINRIRTISEFHKFRGLPKPAHPLISAVDMCEITIYAGEDKMLFDFYFIAMKHAEGVKFKYGQNPYDFDEGILSFLAPNQVFSIGSNDSQKIPSGLMLLIHPDLLWNTTLAKKINDFEFFSYSANEALFLSDKEEIMLTTIIENIRREYSSNMDHYSKQIIISQIETFLSYSESFYARQFITREKLNHQTLAKLDKILDSCLNPETLAAKGLPSVNFVADMLHVSPKYLSSMLKVLTDQNTQQHIHQKLISKAMEILSTTNLSVSEIAYSLGFQHSQAFNKLFKAKTKLTPSAFRKTFN